MQKQNDFKPFISDIIVDIQSEKGLFLILIKNLSSRPLFKVRINFDKNFKGVNGREIPSLEIFKNIEFFAPGKEFKVFVDSFAGYFSRNEPDKINIDINYTDTEGNNISARITHNLNIYRDLGFINNQMKES